jgi:hypothetical protein
VADGDQDAGGGWLLLIYRIPSEPSRLRSAAWRRIKSLGAIYLQNSAAALPASVGAERSLRKLRSEILDMGGTAVLMTCTVLAGQAEVMAAFQAARNDEYEEIVDRCEDFLAQVKKEHVAEHFTYAELDRERGRPGQAAELAGPGPPARRVRCGRPAGGGSRAGRVRAGPGRLRGPGLRGGGGHPLALGARHHGNSGDLVHLTAVTSVL